MKTIDEDIIYKAGSITDGMISNNVPSEICDAYYNGYIDGGKYGKKVTCDKLKTMKMKTQEENISLIIKWFDHISQIADDRKTLNGFVMSRQDALDEIKCLAKRSKEYVEMFMVNNNEN
jgi:hypothetical protein